MAYIFILASVFDHTICLHELAITTTRQFLTLDARNSLTISLLNMDRLTEIYELYKNPSNVLFEEENFLDYRLGGFHPVTLGDTLKDGRYQIHHKLGFGGFSTVWVARDRRHVATLLAIHFPCADGT